MSFFDDNQGTDWKLIITRAALLLVSVTLIVWFLPRNKDQQFHYDIGKPWMYSSFIATFDFPVYKTDEAIKEEQDSLLASFQPYYNYDDSVEVKSLGNLRKNFKNSIPGVPSHIMNILYRRFHYLYQAGIMSSPEYNNVSKDSTNMIRIINGKQATSLQITGIYSTFTAYEQLFADARLTPYRSQLQRANLNEYIFPNLIYDKQRSETERNDLLSGIPIASGMVISGQKIIDRGEIVDEDTYRVLNSFEREMQRRNLNSQELTGTVFGQVLYVLMLFVLFTIYISMFRKDYFAKSRQMTMLYALLAIFPILVSLMVKHNIFSIYILPFTLVPIFIRVFMDARTAFFAHVIMICVCAGAVKYQYEFIIIEIVGGIVAIFSLRELSKRSQVFKTAIYVTLMTSLIYFGISLIQNNGIGKMDISMYQYFIINGVLLLLAYPLMYLIEKAFSFTSNITFIELSDTNKGILRKLSQEAPGTFQHSITVANLASEIANKINANGLLVHTGALYHDIGKMANPIFFTENQAGINPHDQMDYKESARMIIQHVTDGIKLAEENNLPKDITDFIPTHHGRGITKYFYVKFKNEHPEEDVDPEPFTYPGPNPFTREQAILMMCDSCEAASRSLKVYTEENIRELIDKIIDGQVKTGAFTNCPITFGDIKQAKQVLVERLMAIYHTRVVYPNLSRESRENLEEEKKRTGRSE